MTLKLSLAGSRERGSMTCAGQPELVGNRRKSGRKLVSDHQSLNVSQSFFARSFVAVSPASKPCSARYSASAR